MKQKKRKQILSFLLACTLVLNMFVPSLGAEDIQQADTQAVEETQATEPQPPQTQAPETQAPETQPPETQAAEPQEPATQAPETTATETEPPQAQEPASGPSVQETQTDGTSEEANVPGDQEPSANAPELPGPSADAPEEAPENGQDMQAPSTDTPVTEGETAGTETTETQAETQTETEAEADLTFAGLSFALSELPEDAAKEDCLPSRQEEQDDSYIVILPSGQETIETIYIKPEPADPDAFAFVKIGEAEAVKLEPGKWNALDVRAIDFAAEAAAGTETPVVLQVSAEESWEAEHSERYAVHFAQDEPEVMMMALETETSAAPEFTKNLSTSKIRYAVGDEASTLTVKAEGNAAITYQWYVAKKATEEGTPIQGAETASYTPPTTEAELGYRYYYVVVTNTEDGKESSSVSSERQPIAVGNGEQFFIEPAKREYQVDLPWDKPTTLTASVYGYETVTNSGDIHVEVYKSDSASLSIEEKNKVYEFSPYPYIGPQNVDGTLRDYCTFSYQVPRSTQTGTFYYFFRVSFTFKGERKFAISEPYQVTVQVPEGGLPYGEKEGQDPVGTVKVWIDDNMPQRVDGVMDGMGELIDDPGPLGYLCGSEYYAMEVQLYPADDLSTVLARACRQNDVSIEGIESGSVNCVAKADGTSRRNGERGAFSYWKCLLDDWVTEKNLRDYSYENGMLRPGSQVKLRFTLNGGDDLSGDPNAGRKLKKLEVGFEGYTGSQKFWSDFSSDTYEYVMTAKYTNNIVVKAAEAENKKNRVRIFFEEQEYLLGQEIPNKPGSTVKIVVADPAWQPELDTTDNDALATIYTVLIVSNKQTMLPSENIKVEAFMQQGEEPSPPTKCSGSTPTYKATIGKYSIVPSKNPCRVRITLEGLPKGTKAFIKEFGSAEELSFDESYSVFLKEDFSAAPEYEYRITVTNADGQSEFYQLTLTKNARGLSGFGLKGTPAFSETINGQPEGTTFFRLDAQGNETGEIGIDPFVYEYNLYVSPAVKQITRAGNFTITGSEIKGARCEFSVNGEVKYTEANNSESKYLKGLASYLNKNVLQVTEDGLELALKFTFDGDENDTVCYRIHVIQKGIEAAEVEAAIRALPDAASLVYSRDAEDVQRVGTMYDNMPDGERALLSQEAVEKLLAAEAEIDRQYQAGIDRIQAICDLVDSYKAAVTKETAVTPELYDQYAEPVTRSWKLYNKLTDWTLTKFTVDHADYRQALLDAYDAVNRFAILQGLTGEKATDYVDDFMVSSNAYNLTLGADRYAYPITFRDILYSNGRNEGKPYNTPGSLQWEIEDENIVTVESERSTYTDKGIDGGNKEYDDQLYYLIPKQEGTTVLTVRTTEQAGVYYGQVPKIVIHVNSKAEAGIEGLADKLTDINKREHTTKYDTWHYWEGTQGAPFTFHVNGTQAEVTVLPPAGSKGSAASYPVGADGNVTVLLKDGYNPIVVSAVYEGQKVTQVYGLRGKAISCQITNKYRPGEPLRQGDTAVIKIVGLNIPVHKISRIYNPWGGVIWTYDTASLPGQGAVRATTAAGQYGTGYLELLLTGFGTVTLTNGRIEEGWLGSALGSEADQGNEGELASQSDETFSELPDISFDVLPNEDYQYSFRIQPVLSADGAVQPGAELTLELPDLPLAEITDKYPLTGGTTYTTFVSAQTIFNTTLPGVRQVSTEEVENPNLAQSAETALKALKTVTFTVPEGVMSGTYRIHGGYVTVKHGSSAFTVNTDRMFALEIADVEFEVLNPAPGMHTCVWDAGVVTKEASCTEAGVRTYTCTVCGTARTEEIPAKGHSYGAWETESGATVFAPEKQIRSCSVCKNVETRTAGEKLTPTIRLNANSLRLKVKQSTTKLKVSGLAAGDSVVSWKSSNTKIFKVTDSGKITGVKKGSAKLTITLASGLKKTLKVTVQKGAVKTTGITGLSKTLILKKKGKALLKPELKPITSVQKITYKSSNKKVATVTKKGVVKAKKKGKATITVKAGKKKFKIKVTVK